MRFVTVRRHATRKRHHAVSVVPHDPYAWVGNQLGVSCASARRRGGDQERNLLGADCEIDLDVTTPLPDVPVRREREVVLPDQLDCGSSPSERAPPSAHGATSLRHPRRTSLGERAAPRPRSRRGRTGRRHLRAARVSAGSGIAARRPARVNRPVRATHDRERVGSEARRWLRRTAASTNGWGTASSCPPVRAVERERRIPATRRPSRRLQTGGSGLETP